MGSRENANGPPVTTADGPLNGSTAVPARLNARSPATARATLPATSSSLSQCHGQSRAVVQAGRAAGMAKLVGEDVEDHGGGPAEQQYPVHRRSRAEKPPLPRGDQDVAIAQGVKRSLHLRLRRRLTAPHRDHLLAGPSIPMSAACPSARPSGQRPRPPGISCRMSTLASTSAAEHSGARI